MALTELDIWGGIECTVARIRNDYRDQSIDTGHLYRGGDLAAVRRLGIKTLRYPVLFETVAPDDPSQCDWTRADERLAAMRRLDLRPIIGLLHHGSGPRYTSLLDPNMPELLAGYAAKVAARYPWINRFTPVNEPVTTARFSALYGHWYPHAANLRSFVQAVVIQCKAVVLAMRAIRRINSDAQLVQTEDVGKTFSTAALRAQADHENVRRWLSLDLLCGKVDEHHPWYKFLMTCGITQADLDLFREADAAPDIIGVNHYLTSERYLDEAAGRYPHHLRGSNGRETFADVEAVRVGLPRRDLGPAARLREVWSRYQRPIAVTEVHHGCTRDEQLRWLAEVWEAARQVRQEGAEVRAVTVWALFGATDWNTLLTEKRGAYEPGAFDVRAPQPRLTALGKATRCLAASGSFDHPVLDTEGWWHREDRYYGFSGRPMEDASDGRTILITGASKSLARAFARICRVRGLKHRLLAAGGQDDQHPGTVARILRRSRCWAVVDAAFDPAGTGGMTSTASSASLNLARACADLDLPFVTFSSDRVFDGRLGRAYNETDETCPADHAGSVVARHDADVLAAHGKALIIRSGPIFSAWEEQSSTFSKLLLIDDRSNPGTLPRLVISPAYAPDLVHAALDLLVDDERGVFHLVNPGCISVPALAARLRSNEPASPGDCDSPGGLSFALASQRAWPMPSLEDALTRFVRDAALERNIGALIAAE